MWEGSVRTTQEQRKHDREVASLARQLVASGHDVVAAAVISPEGLPLFPDGLPGCRSDHCRTPDLYVIDGDGNPLIIEVETEGSIGWSRTCCQLTTFPRHGRTIVAVPWPFCPGMRSNLRRWGVQGVEVRPY
jgi:hypothetical protein